MESSSTGDLRRWGAQSIPGSFLESAEAVNEGVSKAMADQIATASKQRLRKRLSVLAAADMLGIERIIRVQLGL